MFTKQKILFLILLGFLLFPAVSLAFGELPLATGPTITGLIINVVNVVWMVFAALAIIMFIYAGILFLTAQGAPDKITQAKQAALWGVVGVVVMILAFSIFTILGKIVG